MIAIAGCTLTYYYLTNKQDRIRRLSKESKESDFISIELSELDAGSYLADLPPISTFTWFKGNYQATEKILRERLKQIITKNPWLQGRIKYSFIGKSYLQYPKKDYNNISNINVDENIHVVAPSLSIISRETDIAQIGNIITCNGLSIQNSASDPVFKVIFHAEEIPTKRLVFLYKCHIQYCGRWITILYFGEYALQ